MYVYRRRHVERERDREREIDRAMEEGHMRRALGAINTRDSLSLSISLSFPPSFLLDGEGPDGSVTAPRKPYSAE